MKIPFISQKSQTINNIPFDYKPSVYFNQSVIDKLNEQFKGEIEQKKVKFPDELGEEHPFDFSKIEELYKKFGFFTAVVDKYVDFIVGPGFYIKCEDDRAKTIVEDFIREVNLDTLLRQWCKEALIKGNGFLELGGSKEEGVDGLKILNANYMYLVRDNKGNIKGYNQYKGGFDKFAKEKVIPFEEYEIAHVPFNLIGDCGYGLGIGVTALKLIDDWLNMNNSEHKLMDRKANAPLHAKFGYINGDTKIIPKSEDIQAFGKDLETMSNKTNWVTDPLVDLKVIDFGKVGEKFGPTKESDLDMLIYAFQIPAVILGKANIPEGLAKVQMEAFQRRIQSIQAEFEKIIEQKIFKRILQANGLDVHVEFEWGTPSVMETEGRLNLVSELLKSPIVSGPLNELLEEEIVNLLKLDKDKYEKMKAEQEKVDEERERLEQQPQPKVPGQNAKFPQKVQPKAEQPKQPKPEEILSPLIKMLIEQEEKRNQFIISQQKQLTEEQKKKQEQDMDFIKNIINQMKELSKPKDVSEEIQNKLEKTEQKLEQPVKSIKQKLMKRTSLLPPFRITRKTEYAKSDIKEIPDEKLIVKVKRKKSARNYEEEKQCEHCIEKWDSINDIEEWLGFNYKKYLKHIITSLSAYEFEQLKALSEVELEAGYLSETQINNLKQVLDEGFKKGEGMKEMSKKVDKKVKPKDLYRMNEDGTIKKGASGLPILSRSADKRAIGIVRSEVTRMANLGALEYYKVNNIVNVKWIASFGDRTCSDCEALDGQIFKIGEEPAIPLHPMCRCTYAPVVELK